MQVELTLNTFIFRLPHLLVYNIQDSNQFSFLTSFEATAPVLDFLFLEHGQILVYLEVESDGVGQNPLTLLKLSEDLKSLSQIGDDLIVKCGQDYRDKLKGMCIYFFFTSVSGNVLPLFGVLKTNGKCESHSKLNDYCKL